MWFILCFTVFAAVAARPHHHRGPLPCELPSYVDDLPADAADKVRAIWKDYKEGDKCYNEQGLTREVIDALPKDKRREIYKSLWGMPFLKKAPADVQKAFKELMKDRTIPREDKPKKFKELAEKLLTGANLKAFNKFHEKMEERRAEFKEKVEKLSKDAKDAYEKIEKVEDDKRKIFDSVSDAVREELFELFRDRPHFGGRF